MPISETSESFGRGSRLRAWQLERAFGETSAVNRVNLRLDPGEILAITGPSGSGKSTLLYLLSGVLLPDRGEVWFEEMAVHLASESERSRLRRTSFGFVFQFGQLIPELTAQENVALPLWLQNRVGKEEALARASRQLAQLGIENLGGRMPGTLSGGEAQRVAVARAFVIDPQVVFADEPTGSLDSASGSLVMDALNRLASSTKTSVVLVTHNPEVAQYAHRQAVMLDGRLDEER